MNLYIKKDGVLKKATVPVFVVKDLLLHGLKEDEINTAFRRAVKESLIEPYDLGLFYIDADAKAAVSAQSEFTLEHLEKAVNKKLTRGWKYVELEAATATPDVISASLQ